MGSYFHVIERKVGGIGLAPLIAVAGASSVACLTLAHRLGKGDDGEISDV